MHERLQKAYCAIINDNGANEHDRCDAKVADVSSWVIATSRAKTEAIKKGDVGTLQQMMAKEQNM